MRQIIIMMVLVLVSGCSEKDAPVFTLYSTEFPNNSGRAPVATFDVNQIPETTQQSCQEVADLLKADFEKRKSENKQNQLWATAEAKYWCEKGRYKK